MAEKNPPKAEGLAFGHNLQRAYKIVQLYSADHGASQDCLQQAYSLLTSLLKANPQYTFGFFNQRVVLNDLLAFDNLLASLQGEFSKRGIAAITFHPDITFLEFRRGIGLLTTKPELIEASGGINAFIRQNPVEGLRILSEENWSMFEGSRVLGMDLDSFLTSALETPAGQKSLGLELLAQALGMETPTGFRGTAGEMLALAGKTGLAAWADPSKNLTEVIQSLSRLLEGLAPEHLISALPREKQEQYGGRPVHEIATELAEDVVVEWVGKQMAEAGGGEGGVSGVAAGGETRADTGSAGSGTGGETAGETGGPSGSAWEHEVARVLSRTLKTARVSRRLLQKIGGLGKRVQLPEEVVQRIQGELLWSSLSSEERHARLLEMKEFTEIGLRHLVEHVEEASKEENVERALEVSERFWGWLDSSSGDSRTAGLSWLPELFRALSGTHTLTFVRKLANRLRRELLEETADWKYHREVAKSLAAAARSTVLLDDFETAQKIGWDLHRSLERNPAQHADCCGAALTHLLDPASAERLVKLSLRKDLDPNLRRTVASLLKLAATQTAEAVLRLLEGETAATARGRLIRLAGQLGSNGLEAARKRLADKRWYVVRNACNILGTLGDPDLPAHLKSALGHSDSRVQQAAVASIVKSKASGRGEALAGALPYLQPHLQEAVLEELFLAKDPATVQPLEDFILLASGSKAGIRERAVQVLATIPDPRSADALSRILLDTGQALSLRRAALNALRSSSFPLALERMAEFARLAPADPLAEECRAASSAPGAT